MLKREFYKTRKDGVNLYKSYSDENFYIKQIETGIEYMEAIDVEDAPYTYEETNKKIEEEPSTDGNATEDDYLKALAKLGVE